MSDVLIDFKASIYFLIIFLVSKSFGIDDDYNIVHKDGSFQFGYNNPDSFHLADGNRNNVVRGEFGGRNPKTGQIDTTIYTAGPRGYRPRGKNIFRHYDLNQNGRRPVGSPDDPYFDPYEDPSYDFSFRTRTYNRKEHANRAGDVTGTYSYLDDIGERHNVEFIAGKNTGFHVKTPYPDSNPNSYGPLFFRGRGKPIPRGRTSIQRGLDGSYKFVSAGPDQRRTETSDSTGHVRGSYTYLDDKGVQHSVHYIAGPETGYRILKTVKGPHLPNIFPFSGSGIYPSDFDATDGGGDVGVGGSGDVFDSAASGRPVKPIRGKPSKPSIRPDVDNAISDNDGSAEDKDFKPFPSTTRRPNRPITQKPIIGGFPSGSDEESDVDDDGFGNLFSSGKESSTSNRKPVKPPFNVGGSGGGATTNRPVLSSSTTGIYPSINQPTTSTPTANSNENESSEFSGNESGRPFGKPSSGSSLQIGSKQPCSKCKGTLVTNVGDKPFNVPPGASVRAHVESIDLYPFLGGSQSPNEAYKLETEKHFDREQLNESSNEQKVINSNENSTNESLKRSSSSEEEETEEESTTINQTL